MSNRSKSVQNVMDAWSKANTKSVINSVKKYKQFKLVLIYMQLQTFFLK
jgi:hypothetical protein